MLRLTLHKVNVFLMRVGVVMLMLLFFLPLTFVPARPTLAQESTPPAEPTALEATAEPTAEVTDAAPVPPDPAPPVDPDPVPDTGSDTTEHLLIVGAFVVVVVALYFIYGSVPKSVIETYERRLMAEREAARLTPDFSDDIAVLVKQGVVDFLKGLPEREGLIKLLEGTPAPPTSEGAKG